MLCDHEFARPDLCVEIIIIIMMVIIMPPPRAPEIRSAPPISDGKSVELSDLSIVVDRANDLGEVLVKRALAWDWGSWPQGSQEAKDPDSGERHHLPLKNEGNVADSGWVFLFPHMYIIYSHACI